jgi:hypothetical protein
VESPPERDKKGTALAEPTLVVTFADGRRVDLIPTVRQIWTNIRAKSQSKGVDAAQWIAEKATAEIARLPSPGARENFETLCREGCHPHILGLLLKLNRTYPELQAELTGFTHSPRKLEARARKLDETAAAIESTFSGLSQDLNGMIAALCAYVGRSTPAQQAFELRQTAEILRIAKSIPKQTNVSGLDQVLLYLLCGYVAKATGGPHDLHVSGLIAEIRQDAEYNENALKQWRYRHMSEIDAGGLGEWRLAEFLAALGKVIPHPT